MGHLRSQVDIQRSDWRGRPVPQNQPSARAEV